MWLLVIQQLLIEAALDVVYLPVWWYTKGTKRVGMGCVNWVRSMNAQTAPGLWLKNLFVPMYGLYDWQGRLVSFFMRLVNVIGRSIWLLIGTACIAALFLLWFIFPIILFGLISTGIIQSFGA